MFLLLGLVAVVACTAEYVLRRVLSIPRARLAQDTGPEHGLRSVVHLTLLALLDGLGVVVVSDEEDEIAQLANRVVIVFEGKIVAELRGDYTMKDLILRMEGVI